MNIWNKSWRDIVGVHRELKGRLMMGQRNMLMFYEMGRNDALELCLYRIAVGDELKIHKGDGKLVYECVIKDEDMCPSDIHPLEWIEYFYHGYYCELKTKSISIGEM